MRTVLEIDDLARRRVAEAIREAVLRGETMSDEMMLKIRAAQEEALTLAKAGSDDALLARRAIELVDYVRSGPAPSLLDDAGSSS